MDNRAAGWCNTLSEYVLDGKGVSFSREEVLAQSKLFAHRSALFYTPTMSLPDTYVGEGRLDVTLPIVTPDWTEAIELWTPKSPRFWVDLIQRQTMKIRWKPLVKVKIVITRYDYYTIRGDHFIAGTKALTDALKERTAGNGDVKCLYYFGAIFDDGPDHVEFEWNQVTVDHPGKACVRLVVDDMT